MAKTDNEKYVKRGADLFLYMILHGKLKWSKQIRAK